jgi:O-antigen ligase
MFLDIAGLPMENTLICIGCQYEYFGFPRAVGFAIEPQFLGSLLLAPILLLLVQTYRKTAPFWHSFLTIFLTLTLFMTLSRGAIYALAVGLLVLFIVNFRRLKRNLLTAGLVLACFAASLAVQGGMVALNPNVNETFSAGVAKSLHHLSLGTLDFRKEAKQIETNLTLSDETPTAKSEDSYFDGYVAESTNARLSFNELAFDAWKSSPTAALFGVGLGGAGIAMHQTHPDQIGQLEITQNEYTEIPLELGLIGLLLFIAILAVFFYKTAPRKWTWAIVLAYLVQWIFFSGYPNAIHIYLILFLLLVSPNLELKTRKSLRVDR